MKILLRTDVDGLGRTGDVVDVARGYARNYLVPKGLAVVATAGIAAQSEAMQRKRVMQATEERADAETVADRLKGTVLTTSMKASDEGRLYGSVGSAEVAKALVEQAGVTVDRQLVEGEVAKEIGTHEFTVHLHPEVTAPVTIEVTAED
ncbi:MAG TPA: 50S ribosomal protein L9 [Acidimicrobiales bacterium]|nr:50S ribosomal protein L9 [Actinomycetes bacterium]MDP6105060.1 50S ribosomal protein L9 [Acidimicrobiales bacterium]MDP6239659.1 50S ribosomal protein L9 [Acidimicrobiales bacterium]MDP7352083.1 50S ribosomal protein L9 [Acidimicrobiales bacterium]MDP7507006.1 50S ribosomal protein L9 [Acidimicrobiales bacterium]